MFALMMCVGVARSLTAGDVAIVHVNTANPDSFAFVALTDLAEGTEITFTDNDWDGSEFRPYEGSVTFRVPAGGLPRGSEQLWTSGAADANLWPLSTGFFDLGGSADSVIAFLGSTFTDLDTSPFLYALQYGTLCGINRTRFPTLNPGETAMSLGTYGANGAYAGARAGTKVNLVAGVGDVNTWALSDSRVDYVASAWTVQDGSVAAATPDPPIWKSHMNSGDIAIIGVVRGYPDSFAFVATVDVADGVVIYFTHAQCDSVSFRAGEGTLTFRSTGLLAGTVVHMAPGQVDCSLWSGLGDDFALSMTGNTLLAYTGTADAPHFIYGVQFAAGGGWDGSGVATQVDHTTPFGAAYTGPTTGTREEVLGHLSLISNWDVSTTRQAVPRTSWVIQPAAGTCNGAEVERYQDSTGGLLAKIDCPRLVDLIDQSICALDTTCGIATCAGRSPEDVRALCH